MNGREIAASLPMLWLAALVVAARPAAGAAEPAPLEDPAEAVLTALEARDAALPTLHGLARFDSIVSAMAIADEKDYAQKYRISPPKENGSIFVSTFELDVPAERWRFEALALQEGMYNEWNIQHTLGYRIWPAPPPGEAPSRVPPKHIIPTLITASDGQYIWQHWLAYSYGSVDLVRARGTVVPIVVSVGKGLAVALDGMPFGAWCREYLTSVQVEPLGHEQRILGTRIVNGRVLRYAIVVSPKLGFAPLEFATAATSQDKPTRGYSRRVRYSDHVEVAPGVWVAGTCRHDLFEYREAKGDPWHDTWRLRFRGLKGGPARPTEHYTYAFPLGTVVRAEEGVAAEPEPVNPSSELRRQDLRLERPASAPALGELPTEGR
ncbi:MAG: hypothetical protein HUU35_10360 [Armatimonadetes bacterium]|nr:hypothetical protein [Armatimonadota bacterium]